MKRIITKKPSTGIIEQIEKLKSSKELSYLEAITLWCQENDIEIEEVASIIKKDNNFRLKLQKESEKSHLLK